MFKRILIANRGEIACRIIKTARRLGIETVAVYSEADKDALHVEMADEAVPIGPPRGGRELPRHRQDRRGLPSDRRRGGASGLRLSLRARGVPEGADEGRHRVHRAERQGDRRHGRQDRVARRPLPRRRSRPCRASSASSRTRRTRPGSPTEIGFPVMIKASAGGGGKGMRIAHRPSEVAEGFARARSEAKSSFGDDRVFIEKFIENPRHIEIQVLGDKHGNVIHLGERECSIQRRNQKVVEEAPSPLLDAATRKQDGRAGGRARQGRRLRQRRHGRIRRRAGQELLFPRDEHPPAGRASGDRARHRHRSRRADDPRCGRRDARHQAGGRDADRLGGREPHLRRGPVSQFPAVDRAAGEIPAAAGTAAAPSRCATTPACTKAAKSRSGTIR